MRASPLSRAASSSSPPVRPDPREQTADGGQLDAGLVEGGQDVLDVAQERRVGPDDQHALALEREAVGVEQVGGPVQGDGGLAGARAALHDQDPRQGPRMISSCSRWTVATMSRMRPVRDRSRAASRTCGPDRPRPTPGSRPVRVEQLVLEVEDPLALGQEVAAAGQAHRVGARWPGRTARRPAPASRRPAAPGRRRRWPAGRCGTPPCARRRRSPVHRPSRRSMRPNTSDSRPISSCSSRLRLLRTRMSRSVTAWKVPPRSPKASCSMAGRGGAHGRQPLVGEVHVGLLGRDVRVGHTGNVHFAC